VQEQEAECRAWVEREGWQLTRPAFVDNSFSASRYSRKARPQWQALTAELDAGAIDVLVVWEPSRATRDRRVWAALAATCEERGVRLGVNGRLYDLEDPDDAFQLDLFFALATRESGTTRKRVLRTTRAGAMAGRPHGRLLFGYTRIYREGRQGPELVAQVINEEQALIVRECARRVVAGESLYRIARDLDYCGMKPPYAQAWTSGHVRRMCTNPGYIRKRVHQGKIVGDGLWPAILDEATFYACVSRLADPARNTRKGVGVRHLLSGLASCALCGSPMYVLNNRGTKSYTCRAKQHVSRREVAVDQVVEAAIVERLKRPDLVDLLSPQDSREEVDAARAEAAEKRARLEAFYDAAAAGELTPAALARIEARLLPEIASAERRTRPQAASPLVHETAGPAAAEAWQRLSIEQRREVIDVLCAVRIHAVGRGKRTFDPRTVEIAWKRGMAQEADAK
jgi:site-specific DNA recombinase